MKTRQYYYHLDDYQLRKELTLYTYNGFLIFSSTAVTPKSYETTNYISLLVFFGYPNGTDFEIDISPYIYNADEYSSSNNIFVRLNATMIVENNIFGYKSAEKIRLVSIPEQLNFYSSSTALDTPLVNGDEIDINSLLYQNIEIVKNDGYYYIKYHNRNINKKATSYITNPITIILTKNNSDSNSNSDSNNNSNNNGNTKLILIISIVSGVSVL
jgi:hypothetical protein